MEQRCESKVGADARKASYIISYHIISYLITSLTFSTNLEARLEHLCKESEVPGEAGLRHALHLEEGDADILGVASHVDYAAPLEGTWAKNSPTLSASST